jgi:two-component system, cell cycle response regulator DivK
MRRILVAEDRESSRELLKSILSASGYEVIEAADGEQAVEKARQESPDLVILDLQMPILDGFGALGQIRALPGLNKIPIVALTANAMHGDRERCLAAGFSHYVSKPMNMAQLREDIARLLGKLD